MKFQLLILLSLFFIVSCGSKEFVKRRDYYKDDNHEILKSQMSDSLYLATEGRHVKRRNRVIKTKREAFEHAKLALLETYGGQDNLAERLYAVSLTNGFWIVKAMLPREFTGGTFVAVIDSENGELFCTLHWN